MMFVQKVQSLFQIFVLLHTSHLCIGLTCTEIKTEIRNSFSI